MSYENSTDTESKYRQEFDLLFEKMKMDYEKEQLDDVRYNYTIMSLENSVIQSLQEKYDKCDNVLNLIKQISVGNVAELDENHFKITNAIPIDGKENELKKYSYIYESCMKRINNAIEKHHKKISTMHKFVQKATDKCLNDNCGNFIGNNKSELEMRQCIKDCFNFDLINNKTVINLLSDEYLKYKVTLEKI
jgi:hypothetical protein